MWIAIGTVVIAQIRRMRKKSTLKKLFTPPDGLGYKISKRYNLDQISAAARVLDMETVDDKKTMIIAILKRMNGKYKEACRVLNDVKREL